MLSGLLFVTLLAANPAAKPAEKPATNWDARAGTSSSSLFYGMEEGDIKNRFTVAVNLANTFVGGPPRPEWFWVLRSLESDLDLHLRSELGMKERAKTDVRLVQEFRLAESAESKKQVAQFYDQTVPKILAKRKLERTIDDAMALLLFTRYCSPANKDMNAKIYSHVSSLMGKTGQDRWFTEGGELQMLVDLRDRRCLSITQYKQLASPKAKLLLKSLPKASPAELVQTVYYIMHGGFGDMLTERDIQLVARGQGPSGTWGPPEKEVRNVTPLYGAYVWAFILRQNGKPVSTEEYDTAMLPPATPAPSPDVGAR